MSTTVGTAVTLDSLVEHCRTAFETLAPALRRTLGAHPGLFLCTCCRVQV